jgi:hypothetical protein
VKLRGHRLAVLVAVLVAALLGCPSTRPSPVRESSHAVEQAGAHEAATNEIRASLDQLYRAFGFDAGGEPDWRAMEELFVDGAAFVAPFGAGQTPRAVRAPEFFSDFARYVASDPVRATGLHERILHARIDRFGVVAHAFVAFEGFEPHSGKLRTRGLDSLQLLLDRGRWRVASFSTQYAGAGEPLPRRFLE